MLALWRLLRATTHILRGVFIAVVRFGGLDAGQRRHCVQWWSVELLRTLGIELHVQGEPVPGAALIVSNHVSWLDIIAIDALRPARFVSKSEVRRWPLVGRLVTAGGSLYIERERRRDAMRVVHQMAEALQAGDTLAVFPEGTTSEGRDLLPFHANLLHAAVATRTPVQPIVLRFADAVHAVSPAAAYVGDTSLLQSLWWVARAEGLVAHLHWLPAMAAGDDDRRVLAGRLRAQMSSALRADLEGLAPQALP